MTVSPANGVGECDIKLTFPENKTFAKRTIKVTVTVQDDTDYTYTLVQDAFSGILADWDLNSLTANTSGTFADDVSVQWVLMVTRMCQEPFPVIIGMSMGI